MRHGIDSSINFYIYYSWNNIPKSNLVLTIPKSHFWGFESGDIRNYFPISIIIKQNKTCQNLNERHNKPGHIFAMSRLGFFFIDYYFKNLTFKIGVRIISIRRPSSLLSIVMFRWTPCSVTSKLSNQLSSLIGLITLQKCSLNPQARLCGIYADCRLFPFIHNVLQL